jgi:hypothetical protein
MIDRRKASYRVKTTRRKTGPEQWDWEILRDDEPVAARMRDGPFKSERAALASGTAALREFLVLLQKEQDDG